MPRLHCLAGSNIFAQVDRVFFGLVAFASNECLDRLRSWYESFFTTQMLLEHKFSRLLVPLQAFSLDVFRVFASLEGFEISLIFNVVCLCAFHFRPVVDAHESAEPVVFLISPYLALAVVDGNLFDGHAGSLCFAGELVFLEVTHSDILGCAVCRVANGVANDLLRILCLLAARFERLEKIVR